jgi:O-antigen ligase
MGFSSFKDVSRWDPIIHMKAPSLTNIHASPTTSFPSNSSNAEKTNPWAVFFFAALFFLCSADQFFAVRIFNLNFRYGQGLLLACVIPLLLNWALNLRKLPESIGPNLKILKYWIPFFLVYATACALALEPHRSFLKLAWALFNMGGAALLFLSDRYGRNLLDGTVIGVSLLALLILTQFILLYWFGVTPPTSVSLSDPLILSPGCSCFLGFIQLSGEFDGTKILRPHAYYYEPSYAGCALAFSCLLCLSYAFLRENVRLKNILVSSLVLTAIFSTSSRAAMIGVFISLLIALTGGILMRNRVLVRALFSMLLGAAVLLGSLMITTKARDYFQYVVGPLGLSSSVSRAGDPASSEGRRFANMRESLELERKNPWLGTGVPPLLEGKNYQGLGQTSGNMWLEIIVESGLFGFLAFLYAIFNTLRAFLGSNRNQTVVLLVSAALASHFAISMNFTSTFPRLDYWLLFFFAARICLEAKTRAFKVFGAS